MGVPKGYKHSEEALEKMRQFQRSKGPGVSDETRERMRTSAIAKFERGLPPQTIQNISTAQLRRRREEVLRLGVSGEEYDRQIADGNRWCNHCLRFMDANGFYSPHKRRCSECLRKHLRESYERNRSGRRARAKERYYLNQDGQQRKSKNFKMRRYSASVDWYESTLAEQGNGCAICGCQSSGKSQQSFAVDHNHLCCTERKRSCGKCRRGLLCSRCNASLERIEADSEWGNKALAYLARYPLA